MEEASPGDCSPCQSTSVEAARIDAFGLQVQLPDAGDYVLGFNWPFGGVIGSLSIQSALGAGTCSVLINAVPVDGLTNIAIDTTLREYTASGHNIFVPGDDIILSILTGGGSLINLRATLGFTR